jgi:glycosyltransferase involved in cell wall biosynthesis
MIHVIIPAYNAGNWIGINLRTLQIQTEKNWKAYVCNDLSTDNTKEIVEKEALSDNRIILINNTTKHYSSGNHYEIIHKPEIDDNDICMTVDGDDWLADSKVFERLLTAYSDNNTWMTYGSFIHWAGGKELQPGFASPPEGGIANIRRARWTTTHLRTWKAFLFRQVKKEDLQYENDWVKMAGDLFFMIPMLEMAGDKRAKFLPEINYVYNIASPNNEYKVNLDLQNEMAKTVRNKVPYKQL